MILENSLSRLGLVGIISIHHRTPKWSEVPYLWKKINNLFSFKRGSYMYLICYVQILWGCSIVMIVNVLTTWKKMKTFTIHECSLR